MSDRRIRTNNLALAIVKALAFSTLFLLVFLIGYLAFKGLVKEDVAIGNYMEGEGYPVAIYGGDSSLKQLDWEEVREMLSGSVFSMRTITGYDDELHLYADRDSVARIASFFALSEEEVEGNVQIVDGSSAKIDPGNGSVYVTGAFDAAPKGFRRVALLATVVAVHESVTALVGNKKVGIVDEAQVGQMEDGSLDNWSLLDGADLPVVRCEDFSRLAATPGGYLIADASVAASRTDIELLQVRTARVVPNLTLRYMTTGAIQGGKYGGIGSIVANTFFMIFLSVLFAAPVGLGAAIYLSLYAKKGPLLFVIQSGIDLLASVPSIIFGLFGLLVFVQTFGWSFSLLSGSLTIALMICPTIIRTSQEAIKSVDKSMFDGSIALGATKIETIAKITVPNAREGIIGGIILAIGRAAGETAALLYTIGSGTEVAEGVMSPARSLAMHIYLTVSEGRGLDGAFASSLVLMVIVLLTNRIARLFTKKELQ
jgi:phosphate transport system permease protein